MASENGWGAPRIRGELVKLGFRVSERTVSRYMGRRGRYPERRQSWLTFLRNHREVIAAMDFFVVPTATLRLLYVWFAIRHSRRETVHWSVTERPTAPWVVQQQIPEVPPLWSPGARDRVCARDGYRLFWLHGLARSKPPCGEARASHLRGSSSVDAVLKRPERPQSTLCTDLAWLGSPSRRCRRSRRACRVT